MGLIVINAMAGKNKNTTQRIINQKLVRIQRDVIREKIVLIFIICLKKGKIKINKKNIFFMLN
jgi:hypothetical protein